MKDRIEIIQGDITHQTVDAIVNAANSALLGGGGVDGAIHKAAGPELLAKCRTLYGCETGYAKITEGYKLPAKYIIHTVGPIWRGGNQNEAILLGNAYRNSLQLAVDNNIKTIAFPSISTGVYRYPVDKASEVALSEISRFLANNRSIKKVTIVCFDSHTFDTYNQSYKKLF